MIDDELTWPDFKTWASLTKDVSESLKQAFQQGRSLGYREGRQDEKDEWWQVQEKEILEDEDSQ